MCKTEDMFEYVHVYTNNAFPHFQFCSHLFGISSIIFFNKQIIRWELEYFICNADSTVRILKTWFNLSYCWTANLQKANSKNYYDLIGKIPWILRQQLLTLPFSECVYCYNYNQKSSSNITLKRKGRPWKKNMCTIL